MTDQRRAPRGERMQAVYTQMETISRRAVARNRRTSAPLTVVQHTLLTFIAGTRDCRAIDIAAALRLNRSTISRQVGDLVGLGLVEVASSEAHDHGRVRGHGHESEPEHEPEHESEPDRAGAGSGGPGRGQILALSARGSELLQRSLEANHHELARRLADWTDAEIDVLASGLERFNSVEDE